MSPVTFDSVSSQLDKEVVAADHLLDDHEEEPLLLPTGEEVGVGAFSRLQLREDDPGLHADGECHLRRPHQSPSVHQLGEMANVLVHCLGSELWRRQALPFLCQDLGAPCAVPFGRLLPKTELGSS